MKIIVMTLMLVGFSGGLAWLGVVFLHRNLPNPRIELNRLLSSMHLEVGHDTWDELIRRGERRNRWGATGGGLGFGLGVMTSIVLGGRLGDSGPLLGVLGAVVGIQFGRALSSQLGIEPADTTSPRVAGLQPHGLRDYLRWRHVVAQALCALGGLAALLAGAVMLGTGSPGNGSTLGWLSASLGLFMCVVSTAAFAFQRRLLRAPMLAVGVSDLVANDIALATGLRDFTAAVAIGLFQCGWLGVLSLGLPWWQDGVGLLLCVGVTGLLFGFQPVQPGVAPMAHRLAGVHPA